MILNTISKTKAEVTVRILYIHCKDSLHYRQAEDEAKVRGVGGTESGIVGLRRGKGGFEWIKGDNGEGKAGGDEG